MFEGYHLTGAHPSFPVSAPALQRASLRPDSSYFELNYARQLSASLQDSGTPFSAGELSAIGLMGKIYLAVIDHYLTSLSLNLTALDSFLVERLTQTTAQSALESALDSFPTASSLNRPQDKTKYLFGQDSYPSARHGYYLSLFLILVADQNPALRTRDGFFTDPDLRESQVFKSLSRSFQEFFSTAEIGPAAGLNLLDALLEPLRLHPHSLLDQLTYISQAWKGLLSPDLIQLLLLQMDQLKEEYRLPSSHAPGHSGDPLGHLTSKPTSDFEQIRFSPDGDWMPRVVLLAKNAFVWLDQLSIRYQRPIDRLDQIPEEELQLIAHSGINALWLIGLWERSPASQRIKQLCGNPEAVSSAYSLYDYVISDQLGGEISYQKLSEAAAKYNIRLAADMVPNHVGIDSRWVVDHPEWFLSLDSSPFPAYSFSGVDLSSDPSISIFLEDHYYDKSDASVVFKRVDRSSGQARYLYHGNDGTAMPWNDTAQLDFLNPELREAVIQTILHVARKFSIIRFDAAMTLAKKHFQRLWFPEPGTGGAIPTRSQFSLTKAAFDSLMPEEFWRDVVDRVAQEAPDTLLLAEAFWMMEGYFVRNLGMHRVYNSAFMHMLRDEDNHKFRQLIINTLEIDPQILKRFVNFMNNPDEETAISQFGSDGKYFGTCLMMSTLPGLPMFGHGQIEGFTEKYGMEYKKAYLEESPNTSLIARHESEIFPILRSRYLFSNVENFALFDFELGNGTINPDVFVYSNRYGSERSLVVYHNKWGSTQGRIKTTAPVNGLSRSLAECLDFSSEDGAYLIFTDQITALDQIHSLNTIMSDGLYFDLGAYHYHVFTNFRIVPDHDGSYHKLHDLLGGQGAPNLEYLRSEIKLEPLAQNLVQVLEGLAAQTHPVSDYSQPGEVSIPNKASEDVTASFLADFKSHFPELLPDILGSQEAVLNRLRSLALLNSKQNFLPCQSVLPLLIPWVFFSPADPDRIGDEILPLFSNYFRAALDSEFSSAFHRSLSYRDLQVLFRIWNKVAGNPLDSNLLSDIWFAVPEVREYLGVHDFEGKSYFIKEPMEILIPLTFALFSLDLWSSSSPDSSLDADKFQPILQYHQAAADALANSNFQINDFIRILGAGIEGGVSKA